ncbi:MAG: hypothetical protein KG012_01380 [Deltaproteobacteria bacterium]|nr:hypothetical protein [Deltaproteobacteria bacterium]
MEKINRGLLQFFNEHYKPGIIGIVGTKHTIGMAIREAQKKVTVDGEHSLWSHCFIFGDLRLDRRGKGGKKSRSPYIFESDLKVNLFKPQLRNGAQENWIGKYCRERVENAGVIDLGLSEDETEDILATALQLVDEQVLYPIHELLGTWWAIITKKEWRPNPVDDTHAMYCSAFVRHCYKEARADFLSGKVSISNTTPEHIAQAGIKAGKLIRYKQ